jgi:hypothetical protein
MHEGQSLETLMRRRWREFKALAVFVFDEAAWPLAGTLAGIVIWKMLFWSL